MALVGTIGRYGGGEGRQAWPSEELTSIGERGAQHIAHPTLDCRFTATPQYQPLARRKQASNTARTEVGMKRYIPNASAVLCAFDK